MISCITKKEIKKGEAVKASDIREGIYKLIKKDHPDFDQDCSITLDELNHYRRIYLSSLIEQERGQMDVIDQDVMNALKNNSILSENIEETMEGK